MSSHLDVTVPADGTFVVAATGCCDAGFDGSHGQSGGYQLIINPAAGPIGAIQGSLVDAARGSPLRGDVAPFATAHLQQCQGDNCTEVATQEADAAGHFLFDRDASGHFLPVGSYRVQAEANEYEPASAGPIDVNESEVADLGAIPLTPHAIVISNIQPCDKIPPQGGTCSYSIQVNNNTRRPLRATPWSLVDGSNTGSPLDHTTFEASSRGFLGLARVPVLVPAGGSQLVQFEFGVPSFARSGATFCTRLFLGIAPAPVVNTVREAPLFCVEKDASGFKAMSARRSQAVLRALGRGEPMPRGEAAKKKR